MKRRTLRFGWVILAAFVAVLVLRPVFNRELVPWQTDYRSTFKQAKREKKPRLLYFTAKWCGPCDEMRQTTWSSREVADALVGYIPVKLDVDTYPNIASDFKANLLPGYVIVDGEGKIIKSGSGYMAPDEFVAWLKS